MKNDSSHTFEHYLISQVINLIIMLIVWLVLFYLTVSSNAKIVIESTFWFFFLYFFLVALMYPCFWKPKKNCQPFLMILGIISFCFGMVFLGIFFGIFYDIISREYDKGSNCRIEEIQMADFDGSETYGALGIRFTDQNGNDKLGMGCFSSKKHSLMAFSPHTYSDYKKNDSIGCGPSKDYGIQSISTDELNSLYYTDEKNNSRRNLRLLQVGTGPEPRQRRKKACYYKQNWIELKLPAWNCKDKQQFQDDVKGLEQKLVYDKCYYDPYFSKKGAEKTAQSNDSVIDMKDFYMVVFEEKPYYNKIEFIIFFGFFWVPFITYTHFAWIPYVAHYINNLIIKKLEQRIPKIIQKKEKELRQKLANQKRIVEREQKILQQNDIKLVDQKQKNSCFKKNKKKFKSEIQNLNTEDQFLTTQNNQQSIYVNKLTQKVLVQDNKIVITNHIKRAQQKIQDKNDLEVNQNKSENLDYSIYDNQDQNFPYHNSIPVNCLQLTNQQQTYD